MARLTLTLLILAAWGSSASAQGVFAIRNNILWDATGTPNLGLEFTVSDHFTLGLNGAFKPWPRFLAWDNDATNPARWRYLTLAPELRYYTKQAARPGLFFGANFVYSHFNIGAFDTKIGPFADLQVHRFQGDIYGGTLFVGYGWGLGKHFRLEIAAGGGAGYRQSTEYECARCGAEIGESNGLTFIPKLGLNLVWNIEKRNRVRRELQRTISDFTPAEILPIGDVPSIRDTAAHVIPVQEPKAEPAPQPEPVVTPAVEPAPEPEKPRVERHPLLRPISEYQAYTPDRVLSREEGSVSVWFQFAKSDLLRSVNVRGVERDNTEGLDTIVQVIQEAMADESIHPAKVQVVGFASIDGPSWSNSNVAIHRARAVKSHIVWKTGLDRDLIEVVNGGEAWSELMDELAQRHAAGESQLTQEEYDRVRQVVQSTDDLEVREWRLQQISGGTVYQKMLQTLFADQRSAVCVKVYYEDNNN